METFLLNESMEDYNALVLEQEVEFKDVLNEAILLKENSGLGGKLVDFLIKLLGNAIQILTSVIVRIALFIRQTFRQIKKKFIELVKRERAIRDRKIIFGGRDFLWRGDRVPGVKEFKAIKIDKLALDDSKAKFKKVDNDLNNLYSDSPTTNQEIKFSLADAVDFIKEHESILYSTLDKLETLKFSLDEQYSKLTEMDPNDEVAVSRSRAVVTELLAKQSVYLKFEKTVNRAFSDQMLCFSLVLNIEVYPD